jgi:hypothetical protein
MPNETRSPPLAIRDNVNVLQQNTEMLPDETAGEHVLNLEQQAFIKAMIDRPLRRFH